MQQLDPDTTSRAAGRPAQRLTLELGERAWILERPADLETLWEGIGQDEFGCDERIPYWVELWPASQTLALHLMANSRALAGARCLDLGCGLGLTAIVAASQGARVVAFDYEPDALLYASRNAALNGLGRDEGLAAPLWAVMDWRQPALQARGFDFIWGGDIFYERRFREPLTRLLEECLAPGGRVWMGEPRRSVSTPVWEGFAASGWSVGKTRTEQVEVEGYRVTVDLWELSRP